MADTSRLRHRQAWVCRIRLDRARRSCVFKGGHTRDRVGTVDGRQRLRIAARRLIDVGDAPSLRNLWLGCDPGSKIAGHMSFRDHVSNIMDNLIASGIWSAAIVLAVKFWPRI